MAMIIQVLGAFFAAIVLSILFEIPRRHILWDGVVGALGWLTYLLIAKVGSLAIAVCAASMVISLCSNVLARIQKAPSTAFAIPGMLPLVPGVSIYRGVYDMMINDTQKSSHYLVEALQIAAMLAFGLLLMETIFRFVSNLAAQKLHRAFEYHSDKYKNTKEGK